MPETFLSIDPKTTALVVIDLQKGIAARPVAPHAGSDVIGRAAHLAKQFRRLDATVVLVRVSFTGDGRDRLQKPVDAAMPNWQPPVGWDEIVPELGPEESDIVLTKRQWGAFYGTDLDLRLRRRGIDSIVLCGIATSIGVESTARDAFERNYGLIVVEDAMADMSAEAHSFTVSTIYPRIARVRSTAQVLEALA